MPDDDFKPSRAKGERIGNYRIVRLIGRGGMSEVYLGQGIVAEKRFVAIKVLARRFQNRPDLRKRLERESEIYDALKHPNIVGLHDVGMLDDGTIYLIMELVRGRTLREHIALRRLDLTGALHVMIHVTSAMCFAHRKDVIHRDLKPENIMVTPDGDVKVLDFGIAKFTQGGTDSHEMPRLGTIGFLSPEQIKKEPVDGRSDIYAMGLIFYIVLSGGVHPYETDGEETTDAEMIARHLHATPRPLREILENPNDCPEAVWAIIAKCLAKNPEDRYATTDDLLEDLTEVIRVSLPPTHPVAQRAMEEQEIKRASVEAYAPAKAEPPPPQRVTAELINFTPPTWVTPFERQALPPPAPAAMRGAAPPAPPAEEVRQAPLPPAQQPNPVITQVPTPVPAVPAFAPARSELTPSSSEADAPARRAVQKSPPMQPAPRPVSTKSTPLSDKSIVLVGLATGLVAATLLATIPAFRAAVQRDPGKRPIEVPVVVASTASVSSANPDAGGSIAGSAGGTVVAATVTAPAPTPAPTPTAVAEPRSTATAAEPAPVPATASVRPVSAAPTPPRSAAPAPPRQPGVSPPVAQGTARKVPPSSPQPTPKAAAPPAPEPPKPASNRLFGTEN